jgi:outer membrane murein-binding lipoprotein Lpp
MSWKLKLVLFAAALAAVGIFGLTLYLRGRRVGKATTEVVQVNHEIKKLEEEKSEVSREVHALDTDALHHRILSLAGRVHEQASHH